MVGGVAAAAVIRSHVMATRTYSMCAILQDACRPIYPETSSTFGAYRHAPRGSLTAWWRVLRGSRFP